VAARFAQEPHATRTNRRLETSDDDRYCIMEKVSIENVMLEAHLSQFGQGRAWYLLRIYTKCISVAQKSGGAVTCMEYCMGMSMVEGRTRDSGISNTAVRDRLSQEL
jgi:hypothetical protein